MHYYTAEEAHNGLLTSGGITTISQVPLLIEVRLSRKGWLWKRSHRVRMQLLNEHGITFRWTGSMKNLHVICASLGIRETDAVWQHTSLIEKETQDQGGWTPFLFF